MGYLYLDLTDYLVITGTYVCNYYHYYCYYWNDLRVSCRLHDISHLKTSSIQNLDFKACI